MMRYALWRELFGEKLHLPSTLVEKFFILAFVRHCSYSGEHGSIHAPQHGCLYGVLQGFVHDFYPVCPVLCNDDFCFGMSAHCSGGAHCSEHCSGCCSLVPYQRVYYKEYLLNITKNNLKTCPNVIFYMYFKICVNVKKVMN